MSNPEDERRRAYTAMLFPHEPPPVTAQDAVDMIRWQRELVRSLETERELNNFVARGFEEDYEIKFMGSVPAKTTVEFGPNGLIRLSIPIYPQMPQVSDDEEETEGVYGGLCPIKALLVPPVREEEPSDVPR